jgi:hypothetical protein
MDQRCGLNRSSDRDLCSSSRPKGRLLHDARYPCEARHKAPCRCTMQRVKAKKADLLKLLT